MPGQSPRLPELAAWQAQQLRLTAFPVDPEEAMDRDWWGDVTGQSPESSTKRKLLRTEEGLFEDKVLTLTIDPHRVDWSFAPAVDPLNPPSGFPVLGSFPASIESCERLFQRFLGLSPSIRRLAFGAVLLQPTPTHESGYKTLNDYLHSVQVDPSSSDIQYRINRRRDSRSGIAGLQINRLSTWSVLQWRTQVQVVGLEQVEASRQKPLEGFSCKLELDVNTDPLFTKPFSQNELLPLWEELVALGREIASQGDIP